MAAPELPESANQAFLDAMLRHQIYLMRVSGGIRNQVISLLNASEAELADRIRRRLANARGGLRSPRELKRLQTLLERVRRVRRDAWRRAGELWQQELIDFAQQEPKIVVGLLDSVSPVVLDTRLPDPRQLRSIATSQPFEGRTLRQWAQHVEQEDLRRITNAIRTGMVAGEPSPAIARRVVGTVTLKGRDGVTQVTRRAAESITRTAVNHIGTMAREELYQANADLFERELFVATLDGRTTLICASNDGKTFEIGTGPRPPLHFGCRSLRVPKIGAGPISERPARPTTERLLVREFAQERGLGDISRRSRLPRGTRGAFDRFVRQRLRELTGRSPAKEGYAAWLRRQSREFQDDVLGPTRARLFRDGKLALERFVNRNGDEIPLRDLAEKHAEAFRAAGIDPAGF